LKNNFEQKIIESAKTNLQLVGKAVLTVKQNFFKAILPVLAASP